MLTDFFAHLLPHLSMVTIPTTVPAVFTAAGARATCAHVLAHDTAASIMAGSICSL